MPISAAPELTHVDLDSQVVVGQRLLALGEPLADGLPHVADWNVLVLCWGNRCWLSWGGALAGRWSCGGRRRRTTLELLDVLLQARRVSGQSIGVGMPKHITHLDDSSLWSGSLDLSQWDTSLQSDFPG